MKFNLPDVSHGKIILSGAVSGETFQYHFGKHHRTYVDNLNRLLVGDELENASLEKITLQSKGELFNNAAQAWNHTFYWLGFGGSNGNRDLVREFPELQRLVSSCFGSVDSLISEFIYAGSALFGAGWVWLLYDDSNRKLEIVQTSNADVPFRTRGRPLLVCDVWEHAYYIDYRNERKRYLEAFVRSINWEFVNSNLNSPDICNVTKYMLTNSRASFPGDGIAKQ